jgi:hypothetical protein
MKWTFYLPQCPTNILQVGYKRVGTRTNEATRRIVLSLNSAQKRYWFARAPLIWTLKYTNLLPEHDTCVDDLVWVEFTLYILRMTKLGSLLATMTGETVNRSYFFNR